MECLLDQVTDLFVPGTFGGDPMLIQMVLLPSDNYLDINGVENLSIEVVVALSTMGIAEEPITIPRGLQVVAHPRIIHCHVSSHPKRKMPDELK
eukprot:4656013-Ditylum_brightwellii.AAC.1